MALTWLLCALMQEGAALEGVVLDDSTGAPLANTRVEAPRLRKSVVTDAHGSFQITGVAPGRHRLMVRRAGYADSDHGMPFAARTGERATFRLKPLGEVRGVLVGEDGRPLAGAWLGWGPHTATTDAGGAFVLDSLKPGAFELQIRVPAALVREHARVDPDTKDTFSYARSHNEPAVVVVTGARVDLGQVRLRRQLLVTFSGTLIDEATREPLRGGQVELQPEGGRVYSDETLKRQGTKAGGVFRFELITPGRHTLAVYRDESAGALPYLMTVDVGARGLVGWTARVPEFTTWRARVTPAHLEPSLRLIAADGSVKAAVRRDGEYVWEGVPPGSVEINAGWSRWSSTATPEEVERIFREGPPRWLIEKVLMDGRETSRRLMAMGPAQLEIVFSDASGIVTAEVEGGDEEMQVILRTPFVTVMEPRVEYRIPAGEWKAIAVPARLSVRESLELPCPGETVRVTKNVRSAARLKACR